MRVLFVYPNLYTQMGFNHGLASLSAVLKQTGHATELVNLNENLPPVPTREEIFERVRTWRPGLIGFSCLTQQYHAALELARWLRETAERERVELPPLVVGGIHPTMVPRDVMADGVWDHVGVGECEDALLELVTRLERGETPDDVRNFLSWKGGVRPAGAEHARVMRVERETRPLESAASRPSNASDASNASQAGHASSASQAGESSRESVSTGARATPAPSTASTPALAIDDTAWNHNPVGEFPDFANLPEPDYELFDTQRITDQKQGWFGLMSSRGCPYRCTYCLNHKIVDRYREELGRNVKNIGFFRFRSAEKMVAEIRNVLARYRNIGTFILDDDLFTQNVPHALAFCDLYEKSGIGVPFVVNSHVKQLDERVAEALARAGCRILKLGIESGSPRVRKDVLKRHMTQKDILETVAGAERHRLHSSGFLMVGLPTETRAERWETVDVLAQARIGRFRTSWFYPFPGTDSYRMTIEGGYLRPNAADDFTTFTDGSALDFGEAENVFIDQLGTAMPWFVNARMDRFHEAPAAKRYQPLVEELLAMDRAAWERLKPRVKELDRELSAACVKAGELHYAIRYNKFMGVRSDYFLAEESGAEWYTAAAKPTVEMALAAAAAEMC